MFQTIGAFEFIVIAVVGLLVFGPENFAKYARLADEIRRRFRK